MCFPFFWLCLHDNRCVIFYKLHNFRASIYHKARPDFIRCSSRMLKVFNIKIFVNRHTLCIKMTPKFIMFKDNTTQFSAEINHPALDAIDCTTVRGICCQESHIKAIFNKIINWTVYSFLISRVFIRTSINSNNHYLFSLHGCQFENLLQIQA